MLKSILEIRLNCQNGIQHLLKDNLNAVTKPMNALFLLIVQKVFFKTWL